MSEPETPKPPPARLREGEAPPPGVKPRPARELAGAEAREAVPSAEADVAEVAFEAEGSAWRARVLGRSGRAEGRAPPLLLLGFWVAGEEDGAPVREATVVARCLSELTPLRLEAALGEASAPPRSDRRKPFFEGSSQGRRGGGARGGA
jgi:hypothetical protein